MRFGTVEERKEKFDREGRLGERKRESRMGQKRRTERNVGRGRAREKKRECERLNERGRKTMSRIEFWREDDQKRG